MVISWYTYEAKSELQRHKESTGQCIVCAKVTTKFKSSDRYRKYCSGQCRSRARTVYKNNYCKDCQTPIRTQSKQCRTCHRNSVYKIDHPSRARRDASARANRRRRRRLRQVITDGYTREYIFERDKMLCMICGEPTDPLEKVPHDRAPTIDHIVPISKGGNDTAMNVQCAHFGCNSKKKDRYTPPPA